MIPRNFEITNWFLYADCVGKEGKVNLDYVYLPEYFGCNEYGELGIFNPELGFNRRVSPLWQSPSLSDNALYLAWTHPETQRFTEIELERLVEDQNGRMVFVDKVPGILFVEEEAKDGFLEDLEKYVTSDKVTELTIEWAPVPKQENTSLFHIKSGIEKEGHILTTHNAKVEAAVMKIFTETKHNITKAAVNLVGGQVSVFDATLGFGVGTGVGIRDEAIEVKVLGCGITVGKRVGISVFGNKIEINFGRFFDLFQSNSSPLTLANWDSPNRNYTKYN
ncbi:hypothetical protein B0H13DRAFT_1875475 [Mycena leptocephala]|nr:hypothetical protein B0H13DRAFT_1906099 [Mycena leptocephala]KAJ7911869.1 hypothetical protein B0H13DRAFT_1875475 [Mycena leptocephala]